MYDLIILLSHSLTHFVCRPYRRRARHNKRRINRMRRKRRNADAVNGRWAAFWLWPWLLALSATTPKWMARVSLRNPPLERCWRMPECCPMCSAAGMSQCPQAHGAISGPRSMCRPTPSRRSKPASMCGNWLAMLAAMPIQMAWTTGASSGRRWPSLWVKLTSFC